jgi:hypothetical protein
MVEIVRLQETINIEFLAVEMRRISGGCDLNWHVVPARGHSGGLLMGVTSDCFDVVEFDLGVYCCSGVVVQKTTNYCFEVVNVYGLAQHEFSEDFIGEVMACTRPIVLGGDFNLIRDVCTKI